MSEQDRPAIQPTDLSLPFWDACKRGELVAQRCTSCHQFRHYPQPRCPACGSFEYEWPRLSGRGEIYSYSVSHRAFHPAWQNETPYVIATIELEEGIRMVTDLLGVDSNAVEIGQPVEVYFAEMPGQPAVPRFKFVSER